MSPTWFFLSRILHNLYQSNWLNIFYTASKILTHFHDSSMTHFHFCLKKTFPEIGHMTYPGSYPTYPVWPSSFLFIFLKFSHLHHLRGRKIVIIFIYWQLFTKHKMHFFSFFTFRPKLYFWKYLIGSICFLHSVYVHDSYFINSSWTKRVNLMKYKTSIYLKYWHF